MAEFLPPTVCVWFSQALSVMLGALPVAASTAATKPLLASTLFPGLKSPVSAPAPKQVCEGSLDPGQVLRKTRSARADVGRVTPTGTTTTEDDAVAEEEAAEEEEEDDDSQTPNAKEEPELGHPLQLTLSAWDRCAVGPEPEPEPEPEEVLAPLEPAYSIMERYVAGSLGVTGSHDPASPLLPSNITRGMPLLPSNITSVLTAGALTAGVPPHKLRTHMDP